MIQMSDKSDSFQSESAFVRNVITNRVAIVKLTSLQIIEKVTRFRVWYIYLFHAPKGYTCTCDREGGGTGQISEINNFQNDTETSSPKVKELIG